MKTTINVENLKNLKHLCNSIDDAHSFIDESGGVDPRSERALKELFNKALKLRIEAQKYWQGAAKSQINKAVSDCNEAADAALKWIRMSKLLDAELLSAVERACKQVEIDTIKFKQNQN